MNTCSLALLLIVLLLSFDQVSAFGAGAIPNYAYLHDRAFRHGDIENILASVTKTAPRYARSSHMHTVAAIAAGLQAFWGREDPTKFSRSDIKKIYFGNWLRDYSQAMDIAGLTQLKAETLLMIIQILGFLSFGFATGEYEITPERLGVYLPVEHIDNPKGYAEKEGDARRIHPKLRPPIRARELQIHPANGMKNYIATEGHSWDTSTAFVRRTLAKCIHLGRRARGQDNEFMWEAFRLLGTALHTLEDFLAHSNWCELGLRKLGYKNVFCHVGDKVRIRTPQGIAPPLVTGTFGSADFIHSVLGEATDHLSSASIEDISQRLYGGQEEDAHGILKTFLTQLPLLDSHKEASIEATDDIKHRVYNYQSRITDRNSSEELHSILWEVLVWRDKIMKFIMKAMENVPGLNELIDKITDTLNRFIFTILSPILVPVLQEVTSALQAQSRDVINTRDQYETAFEVFDVPYSSDPSHSILAKDHFDLILNEPAGKISQLVIKYATELVVEAWYNDVQDVSKTLDKILEIIHHPYFSVANSRIQADMLGSLKAWAANIPFKLRRKTLSALSKASVRNGHNKRLPQTEQKGGIVIRWTGGSDSYVDWDDGFSDDGYNLNTCRIL